MGQGLLEILKGFIASTIWLIVVIAGCLFACLADKLKIIKNPVYSIGTVDSYRPGGRLESMIQFQYGVNGKTYYQQYENGENRWFVPEDCGNCLSGNKFMVQYDSINPSIARVLFNYPVIDSVDFKKDLILFRKTPPGY
jgi:hypothetical protein